jgi:MoaA/NifB/PqqE/SkfB family radical SAM enzyme
MEKNDLIDHIHFDYERISTKSLVWYYHNSGMRQKFVDNVQVMEDGVSLVRVPSWSMSTHLARTNTLKLFLPIPDNINVGQYLCNHYLDFGRGGIYNYGHIGDTSYVRDISGRYVFDALINWKLLDECNFNCSYCFFPPWLRQRKARSINIEAFMRCIEGTGKIFHVMFTGGEPFLLPNFTDLVSALTEKHFVSIITNLTSGLIPLFLDKVNRDHIISIAASFHARELERTGLLEQYLRNFENCRKSGIYIYAAEIAHPSYVGHVDKWRDHLKAHNIILHMNSFVGKYRGRPYPESYSDEEIEIFNMQKDNPKRFDQYNNICNAGYNFFVAMPNGDVFPCYQLRREKMGNLFTSFSLQSRLRRCPFSLCECPLNYFNPDLFLKAVANVDLEPRSVSRAHYFIDKVKRQCRHLLTQHK